MPRPKSKSAAKPDSAKRTRKRRENLRNAGLRPIQAWVPDTERPGFAKTCKRQAEMLANDPHEQEILDWLEKAADDIEGWE